MDTQDRIEIEFKFKELNQLLESKGLVIDNHCDFVSVLREKDTNIVVAELCDDNDFNWI